MTEYNKYINTIPLVKRNRAMKYYSSQVLSKNKYSYPTIGKKVKNNLFYNMIVKQECVNIPLKKIVK